MNSQTPAETKAARKDGPLALAVFALLFSVYLLTFSGRYHASDEMSMLAVTDSLARRGAWDIELLRWMGEQQGSFGPDGHLYGRKGIGTSLAALPLYWPALRVTRLGNVQTAMLTNSLATALTGTLLYLLLRRLRYRPGIALSTALAFGLATMAWPYARYLFSESLAGLGLVASFYFLVLFGHAGWLVGAAGQNRDEIQGSTKRNVPTTNWFWPGLAGAGLGFALLARLNNAIVAPVLGLLLLYYLYRRHGPNWRRWIGAILLFGLPVLAALAITGWYNWLRFADLLNTGYLPEEEFSTPFLQGFYGLTLSPGKGLLWYNPLLWVTLIAWPAFFRRHRPEALLAGAVVLLNIAFYSSWFLWWAGHGWGPRFLVTILPFAALPLAEAFRAAANPARRPRAWIIGLAVVLVLSVAVQILAVAVDFNLYLEDIYRELGLYHPATLFDAAYSPLHRQIGYLSLANLDLAWARDGSLDGVALLIGLALAFLSGLALQVARQSRFDGRAGTALLALLGLGAFVSLLRYAPTGDVALAAENLAAMERRGEAAALTEPLLTEPFQDAYDGQLWVWGVAHKEQVETDSEAVWVVGQGDSEPAAARFQIAGGSSPLRLEYYPSSDRDPVSLDLSRLPASTLSEGANLGGKAALLAAQMEGEPVHPGELLSLTLYWRALAPMGTSYTVFVQAIDEQGSKAAQIDRLPCDGGCPTTTWRPGDIVAEWYELRIRPDAPAGRYEVVAGLYDLVSGHRLPQLDAQGKAVADHIRLGSIEVQP